EHTGARKIGEIASDGFYLFQIPGTHHFLRPEIQFKEGYRQELRIKKNEIFYTGDDQPGLFIFLGEEPHLNVERYAEAFFSMVEALGVSRVAAVGGVYGAMPYDKDREVSSVYSLPHLQTELAQYAFKFSNYEGGDTIGSYLVDKAEEKELEFFTFYAFVPAYDFSQLSALVQGVRIENDYKAWYELMRRFNHMFDLGIDLTELQREMDELTTSMDAKIEELEKKMPQLKITEYMAKLTEDFTEMPFMLLDDVWERELGDLLDNIDE
ncbi:MAG: PAC2 family protein, partial [Anaerolineae bacterium]|nr:PAC2 family protein [Anaerolineae bacterium]